MFVLEMVNRGCVRTYLQQEEEEDKKIAEGSPKQAVASLLTAEMIFVADL
jgi:hypothetical protein